MRGQGEACIGSTRGSSVLASAGDVLEISVVRGVGGVCDMCMCLARAGVVGGEWATGLGLGFTNSGGTWGKWDMCLCFVYGGVGGVGEEWVGCLGPGNGVVLCLSELWFLTCICLWQISQIQTRLFNVVGPGLVSTLTAFVRSSASHPADPHGQFAQITVTRAPISGAGRFDTICTAVCDSSTACRQCRLEPAVLFSMCIDPLLVELSKSGYGCHLDGVYTGALSYTDDITKLKICDIFNSKKTVCIKFVDKVIEGENVILMVLI